MKPNATRLTRLTRLFIPSVGPLVTWATCQAAISARQRIRVRPSDGLRWGSRGLGGRRRGGDPLEGQVGIVVGIQLPNGFFGVPHGGHVPVRVAGSQQSHQLLFAVFGEAFFGLGQQPPAAIQAGRSCGRDGPAFRSGLAAGTRRAWSWRRATT